jgi:hypothetical protein
MPCYYPLESVELDIKRPYGFLMRPAGRETKGHLRPYGFQSRLRPSMPSNRV